jgi:nickel-dependent lactate racemase
MTELPYGRKQIEFEAPSNARTLTPESTEPIRNPRDSVAAEIHRYFTQNERFLDRFKNKKTCIVINDNTRCAFNEIIIPLLLKELEVERIDKDGITILVSCGLHAPMSRADLIENLGQHIVNEYKIENHDANGELVPFGRTSRGTPLHFNRSFAEADLKIATGSVVPHFHAGFGGGYKSIVPGISGRLTILKNHSFDMVADERARYGVLDGNPIYEDIVEGGRKSGLHFIINSTVDSNKNMTNLLVGEPWQTHRRAAQLVTKEVRVTFHEPFDVVITTNGGYPLDRNLYQCVKGLAVAEMMVKKGGAIILASECRDGVGHEAFEKYMSYGTSPKEVLDKLKQDEPVNDQDNIQILARILSRVRVFVVTEGVSASTLLAMKMLGATSVEEALGRCDLPDSSKIEVVPGGPYVLPVGV